MPLGWPVNCPSPGLQKPGSERRVGGISLNTFKKEMSGMSALTPLFAGFWMDSCCFLQQCLFDMQARHAGGPGDGLALCAVL